MAHVSAGPVVFGNNMAVVVWVFMGLWMLGPILFTYILLRDGIHTYPWWFSLVLLLFYLFGAAGCAWAFRLPRIRIEIRRGEVLARESFLLWHCEDRFAPARVRVSDVLEEKDSEGDPYFKCELRLPNHRGLVFAESGHRADVEAKRVDMLAALAKA